MALYRPSLIALSLRLCEVAGANTRLCIQVTIPLLSSRLPGDPPTRYESSAASEAVTGKRGGLLACLLARPHCTVQILSVSLLHYDHNVPNPVLVVVELLHFSSCKAELPAHRHGFSVPI